jgi:hypothetical protein
MSTTYDLVAEKIIHFPEILVNAIEIVDFLENKKSIAAGEWLPWMSGGDVDPCQYGLLKELTPGRNWLEPDTTIKEQADRIITNICKALDESFFIYYKTIGFSPAESLKWASNYRRGIETHIAIKKYFDGQQIGPHPDSESLDPIEYTASVYFNSDYDGGDLNFPYYGVSVKPKPGSVIIFPSLYLHESMPISRGTKYVTNILNSIPQNKQTARIDSQ